MLPGIVFLALILVVSPGFSTPEITGEDARALLMTWLTGNKYYPVPDECIELIGSTYSNRGYGIDVVSKGCEGYSNGIVIGRWRVDAATKALFVQNAKGKFVTPDIRYRPAVFEGYKRVYSTGGKVETIAGWLTRETFPGPPEYYSVEKGDEAETYWIVRLNDPIKVRGEFGDIYPVREMQLVFPKPEKQYRRWKHLLGRSVNVEGALFEASTGHHKTNVLIEVSNLKEVKP